MLRQLGRLDEGLAEARAAWADLVDSGDLPAITRAGHDLGNLLRVKGAHEEALGVLARSVEAGQRLAERGNRRAAQWALAARSARAMTCAALGRLEEAIVDQRAVYDHHLRTGHRVAQAVSAYHLATHYADAGTLDLAQRFVEEALELAGELGLPDRAMKCQQLQGRLAEARGEGERGAEHFAAAEFLARESNATDRVWLEIAEKLSAAGGGRLGAGVEREARRRLAASGDAADVARIRALIGR